MVEQHMSKLQYDSKPFKLPGEIFQLQKNLVYLNLANQPEK